MLEDKEHDKLVEQNTWLHDLDEVIAVIKKLLAKDSDWMWPLNTRCKYVILRIDMRDGGFILQDRDGNRISLKQLQWQHGKPTPPTERKP